jgi:hypothetical protein
VLARFKGWWRRATWCRKCDVIIDPSVVYSAAATDAWYSGYLYGAAVALIYTVLLLLLWSIRYCCCCADLYGTAAAALIYTVLLLLWSIRCCCCSDVYGAAAALIYTVLLLLWSIRCCCCSDLYGAAAALIYTVPPLLQPLPATTGHLQTLPGTLQVSKDDPPPHPILCHQSIRHNFGSPRYPDTVCAPPPVKDSPRLLRRI